MAHDLGATHEQMENLARFLYSNSMDVFLFDLPGHGESPLDTITESHHPFMARDVFGRLLSTFSDKGYRHIFTMGVRASGSAALHAGSDPHMRRDNDADPAAGEHSGIRVLPEETCVNINEMYPQLAGSLAINPVSMEEHLEHVLHVLSDDEHVGLCHHAGDEEDDALLNGDFAGSAGLAWRVLSAGPPVLTSVVSTLAPHLMDRAIEQEMDLEQVHNGVVVTLPHSPAPAHLKLANMAEGRFEYYGNYDENGEACRKFDDRDTLFTMIDDWIATTVRHRVERSPWFGPDRMHGEGRGEDDEGFADERDPDAHHNDVVPDEEVQAMYDEAPYLRLWDRRAIHNVASDDVTEFLDEHRGRNVLLIIYDSSQALVPAARFKYISQVVERNAQFVEALDRATVVAVDVVDPACRAFMQNRVLGNRKTPQVYMYPGHESRVDENLDETSHNLFGDEPTASEVQQHRFLEVRPKRMQNNLADFSIFLFAQHFETHPDREWLLEAPHIYHPEPEELPEFYSEYERLYVLFYHASHGTAERTQRVFEDAWVVLEHEGFFDSDPPAVKLAAVECHMAEDQCPRLEETENFVSEILVLYRDGVRAEIFDGDVYALNEVLAFIMHHHEDPLVGEEDHMHDLDAVLPSVDDDGFHTFYESDQALLFFLYEAGCPYNERAGHLVGRVLDAWPLPVPAARIECATAPQACRLLGSGDSALPMLLIVVHGKGPARYRGPITESHVDAFMRKHLPTIGPEHTGEFVLEGDEETIASTRGSVDNLGVFEAKEVDHHSELVPPKPYVDAAE